MHVRAPGSSANLGPGFDCLGLAVDLPFDLIDLSEGMAVPEGFLRSEPTNPATVAFVEAGGDPAAQLWWRSPIPPGRGLGFSGAARVAGAYLGLVTSGRPGAVEVFEHSPGEATVYSENAQDLRLRTFEIASRLEGHPDNAAASTLGGFTVAVGGSATRVVESAELADSLRLIAWSPAAGTSTDASRGVIADTVPLAVVRGSIGRTALWVAAVSSGRGELLRQACIDELHQPQRLSRRQDSAAVLEFFLGNDNVLAAWLSGSGPTVAALVDAAVCPAVVDALAAERPSSAGSEAADSHRVRVLQLAAEGVQLIPD